MVKEVSLSNRELASSECLSAFRYKREKISSLSLAFLTTPYRILPQRSQSPDEVEMNWDEPKSFT